MLVEYIQNAVAMAEYNKLEDGSWFAEIPDVEGVWTNRNSAEIHLQGDLYNGN